VHHDVILSKLGPPWPALAARSVAVGGVSVSFAEALAAANILRSSRTSAIQPVLRAAGSPLAGCDYLAVAAPYMGTAREQPKTGRAGAAGRHLAKNAFIESVALLLTVARDQEIADAMEAFAADERYAVAVARDATGLRERAYLAGVRSTVRSSVARAVAACTAAAGLFTCDSVTACGTGACRFSSPACRGAVTAAGPGRLVRPFNHVRAGEGFTEAEAVTDLLGRPGPRAVVQVWDADALAAGDRAA